MDKNGSHQPLKLIISENKRFAHDQIKFPLLNYAFFISIESELELQ